jgi:peptidoglycan/LPS O-acetylase OafA/YrhL
VAGVINHRRHLLSLDGLRGIAVMMVFLFHYYPRGGRDPIGLLAGGGWMGVDLFFVLSGFLITGILFDTLGQGHYFKNFYARRSLRLFPVYFLMAGLVMALAPWLGVTRSWRDVPFFLYTSNIMNDLHTLPRFGPHIEMGHLWSLAVEEQFYLLWAPAMFLLKTRRRILIACACGIVMSIVLRGTFAISHVWPSYNYFMELPTRLDSLLCGGALALALRSGDGGAWLRTRSGTRWLNAVAMAGPVVLALCVWRAHTSYWNSEAMTRYGYAAAAAMFGAVIVLATVPGTWAERLGGLRWLRVFGRYSYGFYLWHQIPSEAYRQYLTWVDGWLHPGMLAHVVGMAVLFAFNMGIAALSYHGVELYFLKMKRYFAYADERKAHHVNADQDVVVPALAT